MICLISVPLKNRSYIYSLSEPNRTELMQLLMPKTIEIFFLVIFILFIIFPVPVPSSIAPWFDNPLGVAVLFILVVAMLFFTNPLLGVVFILVSYELVRRSSKVSHTRVPMMKYTPGEMERNYQMRKMNENSPPLLELAGSGAATAAEVANKRSLEEEMVIQHGVYESNPAVVDNVKTYFQPVYDNTYHAVPV